MATVIGVMDRPGWRARTDNIVVADPESERLTWVPRDLWVDSLGNRVNTAFARGGHDGLRRALAELGVAADHSVCVQRAAVERLLAGLAVTVPVGEPEEFVYPLRPDTRVQDGAKVVRFEPPAERLTGERIHQWLGARRRPDGAGSDLVRIERQQVLVRTLLREGFDPSPLLEAPELVSASSDAALGEVARVAPHWRFRTLGPVRDRTIDGMTVLVRGRDWSRLLLRSLRIPR
jgi:anionic cell wall polymer biosynthesis LytR-Cps2A-Psr (LCP) family protein